MKSFILAAAIALIAALVLSPSFQLALTGDDYLSLRRFNYYQSLGWQLPQYLLTDYGPQDTYVYLIHRYFDQPAQASYLISFGLRVLAAISFVWPLKYLTGKSRYGWAAALFFAVTATGLETTDWSFNAPSYLAITLLNLWLYMWLSRRQLRSGALFALTIVCQPIRMNFLPMQAVLLEVVRGIIAWPKTNLVKLGMRLGLYIGLAWIVFNFTHIGESTNFRDRSVLSQQYNQSLNQLVTGGPKVWLSPLAQIGNIVIPDTLITYRREEWGLKRTFKRILLPISLGWVTLIMLWKRNTKLLLILGLLWIGYAWYQLMIFTPYPLQPGELLSYLVGGLGVIWSITLLFASPQSYSLGLIIGMGLMVLPLVIPWLRDPNILQPSYGRYLIVPAAGLTWFLVMVMAACRRPLIAVLFGLLLFIHASQSFFYLHRVAKWRNYALATQLRQAIPDVPGFTQTAEPALFYFEGDSQVLYHTLLFGFAEIMAYQYHFTDPHHIASTTSWGEVVSAATDGQAMARFIGQTKIVKLTNIYAYRLQGEELVDITDTVRQRLTWR